jgi:hypothetical protein
VWWCSPSPPLNAVPAGASCTIDAVVMTARALPLLQGAASRVRCDVRLVDVAARNSPQASAARPQQSRHARLTGVSTSSNAEPQLRAEWGRRRRRLARRDAIVAVAAAGHQRGHVAVTVSTAEPRCRH